MINVCGNKSLTILMLNYEFPPLGGGAGNATKYLLEKFADYPDLNIDLITSSVNEFRIDKFADNITIHFLNIKKNNLNLHYQNNKDLLIYSFKAYTYAKKLRKQKRYDLCHAFFGIPCGLVALMLRIPYVVCLRGSDVPFFNQRFYWLDKFIFKRLGKKVWENAEKAVANSEDLKELAQNTAPYLEFTIINNGVDLDMFAPLENKTPGEKIKLISTGRLIQRKGYKYLIESLIDCKQVELTLIGEGDIANSLEELAKKNKIDVKFLGRIDHNDLPNYLKEADIFVLPSLNEGMSNSVLEAMACGLPIITTNTGGSRELIKGNGYVVSKGSAVSLKKAIDNYIKDRALIKIHGAMSRKLVEGMGWDEIAKQYIRAYENIKNNY